MQLVGVGKGADQGGQWCGSCDAHCAEDKQSSHLLGLIK